MNEFVTIHQIYNSKIKRIGDLRFGQYFERENIKGLYLKLDVYNHCRYRCYDFNNNLIAYVNNDEIVLVVENVEIKYHANFR